MFPHIYSVFLHICFVFPHILFFFKHTFLAFCTYVHTCFAFIIIINIRILFISLISRTSDRLHNLSEYKITNTSKVTVSLHRMLSEGFV